MSYQISSKRSPPFWLLIGASKLLCFSAQSEGRTAAAVCNWSGKTLSPGALPAVLYFSSCHIFRPFRLSFAPTICPWVSEDVRRVKFEKFWNITSGIYAKCHVQIMLLLFAYTTTRKQVVISTCRYFKLSWNTTALSQSNCINFSCKYNVVKTTRSLRAAWNSRNTLYSLRKGFQVVYLFECMKTREPCTICQRVEIQRYHTDKGKKFPLNGGCFRKWISTYNSSCYRIESRTTCCIKKNSHDLRGCIEKACVVVTYSG